MQELPYIIQTDEEVRRFIVNLGQQHFADRTKSATHFNRMMDELVEQRKKDTELMNEIKDLRIKQDKKWEEQQKKDTELMNEIKDLRIKQDKKWHEQQKKDTELMNEIKDLRLKHESSIGALGARWGLYSEDSFRNGLRGILEGNFGVRIINITDYDDEGYVFGRPDQVELDIIIKNGVLIICELKSSVSKSDMYIFERKARFYEKKHNRQATELIVISPMVDDRAVKVAEKLNIKVYTHAYDVKP